MVIPRISTQGALEFFDFMNYAQDKDTFGKFRVITDMYRAEWVDDDKEQEQKNDPDAGITLIQKLREKNYTNTVCIYCTNTVKATNKCRNKLKDVYYKDS